MPYGRIPERELIIPALDAVINAGGEITTTQLIAELTVVFEPSGEDADIIEGRQDSKFSQKVRNLVSHRMSRTSMFEKGYAVYNSESESISITDLGRKFMDQVPE